MRTRLITAAICIVTGPLWAEPGAIEPMFAEQQAELEAARERLREAGVPMTIEAFIAQYDQPVPAERDAAVELGAAFDALPEQAEVSAWTRVSRARDGDLPRLADEPEPVHPMEEPVTWDDVRQAMADHAAVFAALDGIDAKLRPAVDEVRADLEIGWVDEGESPIGVLLPDLNAARTTATLLGWKMLLDTHQGRHDEVARTARRIMGLAEAMHQGQPFLVSHLVGIGIDTLAADRLARVAPHLTFGDGGINTMSRDDAQALITLLLDDGYLREAWRRAMESEILAQQDTVDAAIAGNAADFLGWTGDDPAMSRMGSNIALMLSARPSGRFMADHMIEMLDLAEYDRLGEAKIDLPYDDADAELQGMEHLLASIMLPSMNRAAFANYRVRNDRSRAAVALAIALYRSDEGELPATLEALVPDYLPRVPVDAVTPDAEVQYDPDRGIVWTVGEDRTDHGGVSVDDRLRENPDRTARQIKELGTDEVTRVRLPAG